MATIATQLADMKMHTLESENASLKDQLEKFLGNKKLIAAAKRATNKRNAASILEKKKLEARRASEKKKKATYRKKLRETKGDEQYRLDVKNTRITERTKAAARKKLIKHEPSDPEDECDRILAGMGL
jgi:hypothetical protein